MQAYAGRTMDRVLPGQMSKWPSEDSAIGRPKSTPATTMVTPIRDASMTLPGRILYIHSAVASAAGMVKMIVESPQALSPSAFTTTYATEASVMMMMKSVAIEAVKPPTGPIVLAVMRESERPSSRVDAHRITKSCTPPARHAPTTIQAKLGRNPHCAASTGPIKGPGPAMAAKW